MPVISFEDVMKQAAPATASPAAAPAGPQTLTFEQAQALPKAAAPNEGSALGAYVSDVEKIPGAIVGTPRFLMYDVPNWLGGKDGKNPTDPLAKTENAVLPSAEGFNNAVGLSPHLVDHTSLPGKLAGAFIEGGGIRALTKPRTLLDLREFLRSLPEIGKTGLATSVSAGANELDPGNIGLQLGAGFVTHAGASLAGRTAKAGWDNILRPYVRPGAAGEDLAGATTAVVDNSQPGLANPSAMDLVGASDATRNATDALEIGQHPPAVMGTFRDFLDTLKSHLESSRNSTSAPFYNQFRAEPLMDPPEVASKAVRESRWPLGLPDVPDAMARAERNMRGDKGGQRAANNPYGGPLGTKAYTDFNEAGDPVYKTAQVPTPDLLDRTKRQLNIKANQASSNSGAGRDPDTAASRTNQAQQMTEFLKRQYPNSYPAALDAYTKGSEPLTPFEHPDVAKATARNESNNGMDQGPVMGDAELMNHIAASSSPAETVRAFIDAVGDKKTALKPLEDAIVGHLRDTPGVIDAATGEVNAKALDQATRKYMPTVSMYFPELGRKFGNAKAAQATLDNMRAQETLASDVKKGALRASSGVITPGSFDSWLTKNEKMLAQTQSPSTVMRLKQIAGALKDSPFGGAEVVADAAPAGIGLATGHGVEGSFAGSVIGRFTKGPIDKRLAKARDAYSAAIERAVIDPAEAARLGRAISARGRGVSGWQALEQAITSAAKAAPIATIASQKTP